MKVYVLTYNFNCYGDCDFKVVGVYSSYELAQKKSAEYVEHESSWDDDWEWMAIAEMEVDK